MRYFAAVHTDTGAVKKTNQDSLMLKHAEADGKEVLMAVVCDGMGGLSKGELASAAVIKEFENWFMNIFPSEYNGSDLKVIGSEWALMLKELNIRILEYSRDNGIESMGTTFTGILFSGDEYVLVHIGDSRIYYINKFTEQLTTDHTFIAREINRGTMTLEDAKKDKRRNLLLQCVGASANVEPQVKTGIVKDGVYMLCSDGFRHEISEGEMQAFLKPEYMTDRKAMHDRAEYLTEQAKQRGEKDNISVILVRAQ